MEQSEPISPQASFALDAVRAFSAEVVVVGHALSFFDLLPRLQPPFAPDMQSLGVVIFFALSGIVIANSTLRRLERGPYLFRDFLLGRFARIYAGLVPALIVIAVLDAIHIALSPSTYSHGENFTLKAFVGSLMMLEEHPLLAACDRIFHLDLTPGRFGSARPLWSLAIEWWLYLSFGWLTLQKRRDNLRFLLPLVFFLIVPLWNLMSGIGNGITIIWLLGAGIAYLLRRTDRPLFSRRAALIGTTFFTCGFFVRGYAFSRNAYDPLLGTMACAALLFFLVFVRDGAGPSSAHKRLVQTVASFSYTLYLIHYSILELASSLVDRLPPTLLAISGIAISNALAWFLSFAFDSRYRRLEKLLRPALLRGRGTSTNAHEFPPGGAH